MKGPATVNRRTLIASLAFALTMPAIAHAETSPPRCGTAVRSFQPPRDAGSRQGSLSVEVRRQGGIVAPLPTTDQIMDTVIEAGHERAGIEFYIVVREVVPSPPELDLDAVFVTWTSVEGAAAVKRTGTISVLQDGGTRWTIAANHDDDNQDDLVKRVAMEISRLRSEAGPALPELLPTEAALPAGWQLAAERVTPEACER